MCIISILDVDILCFRFGWTVSLQYLITIWLDLAKDNRVLSFIKVGLILVFDECSFSECLL